MFSSYIQYHVSTIIRVLDAISEVLQRIPRITFYYNRYLQHIDPFIYITLIQKINSYKYKILLILFYFFTLFYFVDSYYQNFSNPKLVTISLNHDKSLIFTNQINLRETVPVYIKHPTCTHSSDTKAFPQNKARFCSKDT